MLTAEFDMELFTKTRVVVWRGVATLPYLTCVQAVIF